MVMTKTTTTTIMIIIITHKPLFSEMMVDNRKKSAVTYKDTKTVTEI